MEQKLMRRIFPWDWKFGNGNFINSFGEKITIKRKI